MFILKFTRLSLIAFCFIIVCAMFSGCYKTKNVVLDDYLENILDNDDIQNDNSVDFNATMEEDALFIALNNADTGFDATYTGDGVIWNFHSDGTVYAYKNLAEVYQHTYTLLYSGEGTVNKYIEFTFPEGVKKYRFKKITADGFDVVKLDDAGNDDNVFTFLKGDFYDALFESRTTFEETFYNNNQIWKFGKDGIVKMYGVDGEIYNYDYYLEYQTNDDSDTDAFLYIIEAKGSENEYVLCLKIIDIHDDRFDTNKVNNGIVESKLITFTKN